MTGLLRKRAAATAQPGPDEGFEGQFAQLAFTYVRDRSPRLMDYVVGFQLVDRDPDGAKAVGVFGAKAGGAWMYVPVFFIGGKVKGHELLWLKDSQTFVPNKENWVNAVIARRPFVLGNPTEDPLSQNPFTPNFRRIVRPWENMPKAGNEQVLGKYANWSLPFVQLYARARTRDDFAKQANVDLAEVIDRRGQAAAFAQLYQRLPWLKEAWDRWYGGPAALQALQVRAIKRAAMRALPTLPTPRKQAALRVVRWQGIGTAGEVEAGLTDEQKAQLLKDRLLVVDERAPDQTSEAFYSDPDFSAQGATQAGVYDVITPNGSTRSAAVFPGPIGDRRSTTTLVIPTDVPRDAGYVRSDQVWAVGRNGSTDRLPATGLAEWLDKQGTTQLTDGHYYAACGPDGVATLAFKVDGKIDDELWSVDFPWLSPDLETAPSSPGRALGMRLAVRLNAPGTKLLWSGATLQVPSGYSVIDLGTEGPCGPQAFRAGTPEDITRRVTKQANLRIWDNRGGYTLESGGQRRDLHKQAAVLDLVLGLGLDEATARHMLKEASTIPGKPRDYVVKLAQGFQMAPGPQIPYFPEQDTYGDTFGTSSAIVAPALEESVASVGPEYPPGDPFYPPDPQLMQVAQRASQSGQKEVFDVGAFAAMLKRPLDDTDLGDLARALDTLGNRQFQLYARYEDYESRYGKNDLPELEDGQRNAFEALGDVLLYLQEKDSRGVPGLFAGGTGSETGPGPDMESAANM